MTKGTIKKKYSADFKRRAVASYTNGESPTSICKRMGITTPSLLYAWVTKATKKPAAHTKLTNGDKLNFIIEKNSSKKRIADLKDTTVRDAITYLSHARDAINKDLRNGVVKKLGRAHLMTLLALDQLTGE